MGVFAITNSVIGNTDLKNSQILKNLIIKTEVWPIRKLVDKYHNGKITAFGKWLQRLEQSDKWTKQDKQCAKSYIEDIITTSGVTFQGFVLCPLEYLIHVLKHESEQNLSLKDLWIDMLQWCQEQKAKGVEYIILDGQNRLKFSLKQFIYGDLKVSIPTTDGRVHRNISYSDLPEHLKVEIDKKELVISIIVDGAVEFIKKQLISINAGEPWTPNEKRCVEFTPVSFSLNRTATHPTVVSFFKNLSESKIFTKKYDLEKKGDILFIAELLHVIRNGSVGSSQNLDDMYQVKDDKLKEQLELVNSLFLWVAQHLNEGLISKKHLRKEVLRDVFIFLSMLVNKKTHFSSGMSYNLKLNQITSPDTFLKDLISSIEEERSNKDQCQVTIDSNGNEVRKEENVLPNTFMDNHNGTSAKNISFRVKFYKPIFEELIEEFINKGVIKKLTSRFIPSDVKDDVYKKYGESGCLDIHERFPTSNVSSMKNMEIDHIQPVAKDGSNDISNLTLTSRKNNRRKGSN